MQSVIIGSIGISPIINSITTISTSIFTILKNIKLSKNNQEDVMAVLNKTDIEATVTLLQNIISDISCLPYTEYFGNNKFIIIALNNVKESIADIELELIDLKKKINYNSSLYIMETKTRSQLFPDKEYDTLLDELEEGDYELKSELYKVTVLVSVSDNSCN